MAMVDFILRLQDLRGKQKIYVCYQLYNWLIYYKGEGSKFLKFADFYMEWLDKEHYVCLYRALIHRFVPFDFIIFEEILGKLMWILSI